MSIKFFGLPNKELLFKLDILISKKDLFFEAKKKFSL